jgi:hypothetical protein
VSLTSGWRYDLFVSYSRTDNIVPEGCAHGWVETFLQALQIEHRRFSTRPLRIFLDREDIGVMDYWRRAILGSLRNSNLLVTFLSPNYFRSRYCRWEWEAWLEHEHKRSVNGEGIAPIYLSEIPGFGHGKVNEEVDDWILDIERRNHFDFRAFASSGKNVLENEDFRLRLEALDAAFAERIDRSARSAKAPGRLRRRNLRFVGRRNELAELREMLGCRRVGVVTAVHGLGGVGKTALVDEYAHAFAGEYPRWSLGNRLFKPAKSG